MDRESWDDINLNGKRAIVTGAARGIGRAIVFRLAGLGADVQMWDIDVSELKKACAELQTYLAEAGRPYSISTAIVDVTSVDQVKHAMADFGIQGIDILVNNAGTTSVFSIAELPEEVWEKTIKLNLTGVFYCTKYALAYMKRDARSCIINISSSASIVGGGGGAHYAASKAAIDGMTRHLAKELAPIRVNSVQPRTIQTDLFVARYSHNPEEVERIKKGIPLGRVGLPIDIANVVAFLASDWASYITGQSILVDGGRSFT